MRYICPLIPTLLLSALALPAQSGSYTTFGSGCASSVTKCPSSNPTVTKVPTRNHNSNIFAHPIVPTSNLIVLGFRYYNKTVGNVPLKITTEIYKADSTGKPKNPPIAKGFMIVTPKLNWHVTKLSKPILFKKGEKFFISHLGGTKVSWSWDESPTAARTTHYWHAPTRTTWSGPFKSVRWAWKVDCAGGKTITNLTNTGVPKINASFSVNLSGALPSTAGLLLIGGSKSKFAGLNLPLDMKIVGASGCNLYTSMDALLPTLVDKQGKSAFKLGLPNDSNFLGIKFHNQFMVLDKAANTFGFSFSNGGTGVVGK